MHNRLGFLFYVIVLKLDKEVFIYMSTLELESTWVLHTFSLHEDADFFMKTFFSANVLIIKQNFCQLIAWNGLVLPLHLLLALFFKH